MDLEWRLGGILPETPPGIRHRVDVSRKLFTIRGLPRLIMHSYTHITVVSAKRFFREGVSGPARVTTMTTSACTEEPFDAGDDIEQCGEALEENHGLQSPGNNYSSYQMREGDNPATSLSVAFRETVTYIVVMGRRDLRPSSSRRRFRM